VVPARLAGPHRWLLPSWPQGREVKIQLDRIHDDSFG
jgi:hypothetical protein